MSGTLRFIGTLTNNTIHYFFPFQTIPFVIFGIFFHTLNSVLVFILMKRFTNSYFLSGITGILFCTAYLPSQSMLWFSAHTTTLGSTTFFLLALNSMIYFKKYKFFLSIAFAYLAVLTKESAAIIFLLLPVFSFVNEKKVPVYVFLKRIIVFIILFSLLMMLRSLSFLGGENQQGLFLNNSNSSIVTIFIHMILYPLVGFGHYFSGFPGYLQFLSKIQDIMYPSLSNNTFSAQITGTVLADFLSVVITLSIWLILCFLWNKIVMKKIFLLSGSIVFLSFLPYIVLLKGYNGLFESRYYYVGMIGAAIFFTIFLNEILKILLRNSFYVKLTMVFIVAFIGIKHSQWIQRDLLRYNLIANERKLFLSQIKNFFPTIPPKTVFFVQGDSPGMYGIADLAVPFQQGLGYTLMVWYYDTGIIPKQLLREAFLWNINSQGYSQIEEHSFGYFWDSQKLLDAIVKKDISIDQVIALRYLAGEKQLVNITEEIKNKFSKNTNL